MPTIFRRTFVNTTSSLNTKFNLFLLVDALNIRSGAPCMEQKRCCYLRCLHLSEQTQYTLFTYHSQALKRSSALYTVKHNDTTQRLNLFFQPISKCKVKMLTSRE